MYTIELGTSPQKAKIYSLMQVARDRERRDKGKKIQEGSCDVSTARTSVWRHCI